MVKIFWLESMPSFSIMNATLGRDRHSGCA